MGANNSNLVTIISGFYNRKENLKKSVDSVLEQTYDNFEYLIFDDFSTDGTRELLQEINDERIKLILHPFNLGFVKGLISAIHMSNGRYIALHGAGDISLKHRIEMQVELICSSKAGMVGCTYEDVYTNSSEIKQTYLDHEFTHGEVMFDKNIYYLTGGYNKLLYYGQLTQLKHEFKKISSLGSVKELSYRRINYANGTTLNNKKRFEQKFFIQSGIALSKSPKALLNYDKNKILEKTYYKLMGKDLDKSTFFKYYKGSLLLKYVFYCHYIGIIPSFFIKLLRKIRS